MDWRNVDYLWIIVMFLSALWTLILTAPIHCRGSIWWASDIMLNKYKSVPMQKQTDQQKEKRKRKKNNLGWLEDKNIYIIWYIASTHKHPRIYKSQFGGILQKRLFWIMSNLKNRNCIKVLVHPKNENSVINYSHSCSFKHIFETQMNTYLLKP